MKILVLGLTLLATANCYQRCLPDFSWKPFNGVIPKRAFMAGLDNKGNPTYIAKTVILDDGTMWTIPAQLYQGIDYINYRWYKSESKELMKINKFIQILVTNEKNTLRWVNVQNGSDSETSLKAIAEKCCIVEGGIGVKDGHVYLAYVGKTIPDGQTSYIGRLYKDKWQNLFFMNGTISTKSIDDIRVLTYGCNDLSKVIVFKRPRVSK